MNTEELLNATGIEITLHNGHVRIDGVVYVTETTIEAIRQAARAAETTARTGITPDNCIISSHDMPVWDERARELHEAADQLEASGAPPTADDIREEEEPAGTEDPRAASKTLAAVILAALVLVLPACSPTPAPEPSGPPPSAAAWTQTRLNLEAELAK